MTSHEREDANATAARSVMSDGFALNSLIPTQTAFALPARSTAGTHLPRGWFLGHGLWIRQLWLPSGIHQYLLVVDGEWVFDLNATDYLPNVFGGMNAVVDVSAPRKCERRLAAPTSSSFGLSTTKNGEASPTCVPCFA